MQLIGVPIKYFNDPVSIIALGIVISIAAIGGLAWMIYCANDKIKHPEKYKNKSS